jgi:tetrahydromethanopterin S-methyltransferase subunit A
MERFGYLLSRTFARTRPVRHEWPYIPGKYFVLNPAAPVALTTLGSVPLAREVARVGPDGLCIVGKLETENIGIEKIIRNVIANPAIRVLVCAGQEPPKHLTGATLLALSANGTNGDKRILGSPARRPKLPNITVEEVDTFRRQVAVVDMIGCDDLSELAARVGELAVEASHGMATARPYPEPTGHGAISRVAAVAPSSESIELDPAGYFVIGVEGQMIVVEHYDYRERLLHVVEGEDARSVYWTLIDNGWVTRLDHAAYLGKELARAEHSQREGGEFVQDGA